MKKDRIFSQMLLKNHPFSFPLEAVLHGFFWLSYFLFPFLMFGDQTWFQFDWEGRLINSTLLGITVYGFYLSYLYLLRNILLLLPALSLVGFLIYVNCLYNILDCNCSFRICLIQKGIAYIFVNILFIAISVFKKNLLHQRAFQKSEEERVRAELNGLKSQINPHFLFNTLNMLYANAIDKDGVLAANILKLSDNLHYLLHEGSKQFVTLEKEVAFITDYIGLQEERLAEKIAVNFQLQTDNPATQLPPLLLIPFVENAFKYTSMMKGKNLPITIKLEVENKKLHLEVHNAFHPRDASKPSEALKSSGIGLKNVRRRLSLLYPKSFTLESQQLEDVYSVTLVIEKL